MINENKLDSNAVAPSENDRFDFIRSHRLWRYGPLILWAAFIFVASTKPRRTPARSCGWSWSGWFRISAKRR